MKTPAGNYTITLNKETFDALMCVKDTLGKGLGFEPTNGQVVKYLVSIFTDGTEIPFTRG